MAVFRVGPLPQSPLEAAAAFHARVLPELVSQRNGQGHLVLVFPRASHDHGAWRLAAVQGLARAAAPARVNGIAGDDEAAIAETAAWLESASGVTGQLLAVDGNSGGKG